jgi:hypothetical protein
MVFGVALYPLATQLEDLLVKLQVCVLSMIFLFRTQLVNPGIVMVKIKFHFVYFILMNSF